MKEWPEVNIGGRESSQDLPGYGSIDISSLYQPFKPWGGGSGKSLTLMSVADFQSEGNGSQIIFDKNKIKINRSQHGLCSAADTEWWLQKVLLQVPLSVLVVGCRLLDVATTWYNIRTNNWGVNLSVCELYSQVTVAKAGEKPDYGFLWFQFSAVINGQTWS